jgi:hypothetical protein
VPFSVDAYDGATSWVQGGLHGNENCMEMRRPSIKRLAKKEAKLKL